MIEPDPAFVEGLFDRLAPRYDRFNRWSSLGLDAWWRARTVAALGPGDRVLDLGCGTGDLALAAWRRVRPSGSVTGADLSAGMLAAARAKAARAKAPLAFVRASAEALPFPDGAFDAVVSAFVLRSLAGVRDAAARETARVLRPGGRAFLLELTRPRFAPLRALHRAYVTRVVPAVGVLAAGARWPDGYLADTVLSFPEPEAYAAWFTSHGFVQAAARRLTGGVCSLLVLTRAGGAG